MMNKSLKPLLLTLMLLCAGVSQAQNDPLNEARWAQEAGDYAKAATLYLPLAEQGNSSAQYNLGVLFSQGRVIQQDYNEAVHWYMAAAQQGHPQAQADLGEMYLKGKGVQQDYRKAMQWFTSAANLGDATAQLHIGDLYSQGKGIPQNHEEAVKWYRKAGGSNAEAQSRLADCYEKGEGVEQNSETAIHWLEQAAFYATDDKARNIYLAKRDGIRNSIHEREQAKADQLAREEAMRNEEAAAKLAEEQRIEAAKLAAEQAQLAAAEQAAIAAEKEAARQAEIDARAVVLRAKQMAQEEANRARSAREAKSLASRMKNRSWFKALKKAEADEKAAKLKEQKEALAEKKRTEKESQSLARAAVLEEKAKLKAEKNAAHGEKAAETKTSHQTETEPPKVPPHQVESKTKPAAVLHQNVPKVAPPKETDKPAVEHSKPDEHVEIAPLNIDPEQPFQTSYESDAIKARKRALALEAAQIAAREKNTRLAGKKKTTVKNNPAREKHKTQYEFDAMEARRKAQAIESAQIAARKKEREDSPAPEKSAHYDPDHPLMTDADKPNPAEIHSEKRPEKIKQIEWSKI